MTASTLFFLTLRNPQGEVIPHSPLTFLDHSTGTLSSVYDEAGNAVANPVFSDANGLVQAYLAAGNYDLVFLGMRLRNLSFAASGGGGGSGTVTGGSTEESGHPVFDASNSTSTTLHFKGLVAGSNVTITDDGTGSLTIAASSGGGSAAQRIIIEDQAANGVGRTAAGPQQTWAIRPLSTIVRDDTGVVTLIANVIHLPAGTYNFHAVCPFASSQRSRARLYNVTDAAIIQIGIGVFAPSTTTLSPSSIVQGTFTIAAAKDVRLEYYMEAITGAGYDFGYPNAEGAEGTELWASLVFDKTA